MLNDELKIYRGNDFVVSKHIVIHQPTLDEICEYGEREYYSMVHHICSTPQSLKWQLWDKGIDYTTITPYELFYNMLYMTYPQGQTAIIFGDLDLTHFRVVHNEENDSVLLRQEIYSGDIYLEDKLVYSFSNLFDASRFVGCKVEKIIHDLSTSNMCMGYTFSNIQQEEVVIDEFTYNMITDYLRQIHLIEKDEKMPANESTKMVLIEDDRDEYLRNVGKEYHSYLKNLISALINSEGFKYNHSQVWDMKINAFMDSVKRISKIKNADLLLQSGYSGYGVNLKDIDNKKLDWLGELD